MNNTRVFISYDWEDSAIATEIKNELEKSGLEVISDEFIIGENFTDTLSQKVKSSDYLIILLSDFNNNKWMRYEINNIIKEFYLRNVSIIPIQVSRNKSSYKIDGLKTFKYYENDKTNVHNITKYLKNIVHLDFNKLNSNDFNNLIIDLLTKSNFKILENNLSKAIDPGFDFIASLSTRNQMIGKITTNWIIECKLYGHSRVDISSIEKMSNILLNTYPGYNGVLITNSLLTSTANETLEIVKEKKKVNIEIVDGKKLKELVLKYPEIVERYFKDNWRE